MAGKKKNVVEHRQRKNPKSAEAYQEVKHEKNSKRPKQTFNENTKTWSR